MPYIDCNKERLATENTPYDFTIIGSGAAGILLAVKLSEKGKRVLLVEAGHFEEDPERQKLNNILQTGKDLTSSVSGRKRAVGGTTIAWGGQSLPFSPIDFSRRDWVSESGWPIKQEELQEYYMKANRFMNIDELDYEDDIFSMLKIKKQPFNSDLLSYHFSKWAPEPNFRKLYNDKLEKDITVLYNAVTTQINIDDSKQAKSITVKNFKKGVISIPVTNLILATGAVESARLLLASNHQIAEGLGNHSGWLGKCFMEHPCIEVGFVETKKQYKLQAAFNTHLYNKRKYSIRLSLSDKAQRDKQLLNASAGIMFDYLDDSFDPYIEVREYLNTKKITSLLGVVNNIGAYAISAKALLIDKLIYKHNARARVVMMLEQEPLPESTIRLAEETDMIGMPKVSLNWKISKKTWDTVIATSGYIKEEVKRLGFGELHIHNHINKDNKDWELLLSDVNHHMGGTRMSSTSEMGVVNPDLQLWEHRNIYVCSTSVFPTVSHSNPTLTMMALCLKLVHNLTK